ncbi:MAG TPA: GGDEF domain-containing protein [Elusimicrobiota bacterium]|nr:GGDEF domain-containing protein [Elusimicrobiota bacterium]HMX42522.1 GGDEF domain-containing protein [Elusimicrobiota bacterium]HNC74045.1 GGDEF domain-containing protein [Elusimicrobiota bacterium]HND64503.1 GGDEF domain-containing protein [Elusimicrobiota bacterium]HNG44462.1 GGDEF domain-containing protein [Elusimicrobiota bacterium]
MTPASLPESQPLMLASLMGRGRWAPTVVLFLGPVGLPLFGGLIVWAMVRGPWPAADVFPLFVGLELLLYLGAGLGWSFGAALAATGLGLLGFFFSTAPQARLLFAAHIALLWTVFAVLNLFDRRRQTAWNRFHEEWDGLEMDLAHTQTDVDSTRALIEDSRARIVAFDRLQLFTDDLIGPYHREELLGKAQTGLSAMFPRARVSLHMFPKPDAPSPEDELGMKMLQWGQPRLLASRAGTVPTWDQGLVIVLPVKGRENFLGWILLESKNPDAPFEIHDLRLASIASDLIALALGNTERFSQTEALAISDELTGVYTRGYFNERLQEEFAKARHKGRPFTLVLLDIDHFKKVNDLHGHHIGDEVLRWLARLVTGQARETDFVARYGGEEFVVLMPNTRGADAFRFTQRLCKTIATTPFRWGAKKIKITLSAGVACLKDEVTAEEDLIRRADEALYAAKNGGRNRVCNYDA